MSTVSFSSTNDLISGLNTPNKSFRHEDDFRMSFCYKRAIDSRVIGLGTWCGRTKSHQRGGKLKSPYLVCFKDNTFWSIGICAYYTLDIVDKHLDFTFKVLLNHLTYIRRSKYLEISELGVFYLFLLAMFVVKLTDFIPEKLL